MKNISAFVVLSAFIISVVLTGCGRLKEDDFLAWRDGPIIDEETGERGEGYVAKQEKSFADLNSALSSLDGKVDQQKDSLTESIDRAKNESIAASEQGDADTIAAAKAYTDEVGERVHKAAKSAVAKAEAARDEHDEAIRETISALDSKAGDAAQNLEQAIADNKAALAANTQFVENAKKWQAAQPQRVAKVHFSSGRTGLNAAAKKALDDIIAKINEHGDAKIVVAGHADGNPVLSGSYRSNWDLSQARAESVAKYLKQKGVSNTIETVGHGHTKPIGPTNTKAGRDMNRRASVTLHP
jgi:outer membrane protein OmpA-like peptidoglycan-associated protein